jgi:hypothetical protein
MGLTRNVTLFEWHWPGEKTKIAHCHFKQVPKGHERRNWGSGLEPGTFTFLYVGSPHNKVAISHGIMAALRLHYHLQQTRCEWNVSCSRCGHIWLHVSSRQFSPFSFLLHPLSFSVLFYNFLQQRSRHFSVLTWLNILPSVVMVMTRNMNSGRGWGWVGVGRSHDKITSSKDSQILI